MKTKSILITSIFLFIAFLFPVKCLAADNIGVIIITNSKNQNTIKVTDSLKEYLKLLRGINTSVFGKEIFWIKTYDYGDDKFIPFCREVLKVEKDSIPYTALSKLNDDYTFKEFIPDTSVSKISASMDASYKIMDSFRKLLSKEDSEKLVSRLTGIKSIKSEPESAEVKINGEKAGVTPLKNLVLKPGSYTITYTLNDYIDLSKKIEIKENQFTDINGKMEKINAFIEINTEPSGAEVTVNDIPLGKTPVNQKIIPGKKRIEISLRNYKKYTKKYIIKNNTKFRKNVKLLPDKVRCYIKANGYYIKEYRKIDMHRSAEITRTIYSKGLQEKLSDIITSTQILRPVADSNKADIILKYEAWPKIPLKGKIQVKDKSGKVILTKEDKISISPLASDDTCLNKSVELFRKKFLPLLLQYSEKMLQYPDN